MYLYLVRHGEAKEDQLTEKGMLEVSEMAAFLSAANIKVDEIWHSVKLRAKHTADIIAEAIGHKNLVEREGLSPDNPVDKIAAEIIPLHENVMIVGHLPFLEKLAAKLLTNSDKLRLYDFKAGAILCLEKWEEGWSMNWMVPPGLLSRCMDK